jgi:hypothetical protein
LDGAPLHSVTGRRSRDNKYPRWHTQRECCPASSMGGPREATEGAAGATVPRGQFSPTVDFCTVQNLGGVAQSLSLTTDRPLTHTHHPPAVTTHVCSPHSHPLTHSPTPPPPGRGKVFTEEELETDSRTLIAVDGKVYDVSDFLDSHPGSYCSARCSLCLPYATQPCLAAN